MGGTNNWSNGRVRLGTFEVASVYRGVCHLRIARIGVMTHEFLHTLGLPDLYDVGGRYMGGNSVGGLGGYDIMANPFGQGNRQAWPGHLSPWPKYNLGWVTPIEITQDGTYTARPSELYPDIYIIQQGYDVGEYLMVENRQPLEFDANMWTGGILIYHIVVPPDGYIGGNEPRGFPGQPGWPANGNHYPVALLQADGLYELEKAESNGGPDDFYLSTSQRLGPGNGELVATSAGIYPNTDSYAFGIRATGIIIDNFQETESGVWSFRVQGMGRATSLPSTNSPTASPTKTSASNDAFQPVNVSHTSSHTTAAPSPSVRLNITDVPRQSPAVTIQPSAPMKIQKEIVSTHSPTSRDGTDNSSLSYQSAGISLYNISPFSPFLLSTVTLWWLF